MQSCVDEGNFVLRFLYAVLLSLMFSPAFADCSSMSLKGVNLSGAEYNSRKVPGILFKEYVYPAEQDLAYFANAGASVIRLPVLWERMQAELNSPLNEQEMKHIQQVVETAKKYQLCILLDIHNYGSYRGSAIGTEQVPVTAFVDFWRRTAEYFKNDKYVAFGLMNEPHVVPVDQWALIANRVLQTLRTTGVGNLVLVPGGRWSGVHDWFAGSGDAVNALALANIRDPLRRMVLEVHQYADADSSGTHSTCVEPARLKIAFARLTQWARERRQKLFLGEFGVAANEDCLTDLRAMLDSVNDRSVWQGWAYWTAGRWIGSNYPFSVQPQSGMDTVQMTVLRKYLVD